VVSLVNLVVEGDSMAEASTLARRAASFLRKGVPEEVKVLGPAFAVRSKIAGRYRSQILLKLPRREHGRARAALRGMLKDEELLRSTVVDVDPMNLS
jgi:primosomal protein N'